MNASVIRFAFVLAGGLCLLVACGGSSTLGGGSLTPGGSGPTHAPASVATSFPASATAATLPLPLFAGYSGTLSIPAAFENGTVNLTLSLQAPSGAPPLAGVRHPEALVDAPLLYLTLESATKIDFEADPLLTLTVPSSVDTAIGQFYFSLDSGGAWTILSPAVIIGSQLTFIGDFVSIGTGVCGPGGCPPSIAFTLPANQPAYLAVYQETGTAPAPAPTPTPTPTPTP